ncbi:MAG: Rne/Rng family ribonuclease [Pseudomonadales bacterium]
MKRMLINATQPEEVRVALVDGQKLYDLDIENRGREQKKGSIYKARISRVEPSLEAAFVEYGADRHGFLPLKEISRQYFKPSSGESGGRVLIQEVIQEGQEVLVQVDKEERGTKGAALTTFISLAGRCLVLMPNNPRAGGISRRIEGEERDELREALSKLEIPQGMGVIVRTAGIGRSAEELQWDLDYLLQLWEAIRTAADQERAPSLLYQENNVILRAIRDNLRRDIGEVLIDGKDAYDEANAFIELVMPHYKDRVKYYTDNIPLFSRYQIESQIETAFHHTVKLPSGGSLVIDPTEALVSIDINSARATKGADIEETALNTNLEAADEIARQLRLRDVGGLIVIDFIDMTGVKNQRAVENRLREALEADRARIQVGRISRFGLMEMSRQRLRPSLEELTTEICPRCSGQGRIRVTSSLALGILRVMEEEALKERSSMVRALVPLNVASYLLNEKRDDVAEIERRTGTHLVIIPNVNMETPQYEVQRIRDDQLAEEASVPSYELTDTGSQPVVVERRPEAPSAPRAAVQPIRPAAPAPRRPEAPAPVESEAPAATPAAPPPAEAEKPGFLRRLTATLFGTGPQPAAAGPVPARSAGAAGAAGGSTPAQESTGRARDGRQNRGGRGARDAGAEAAGEPSRDNGRSTSRDSRQASERAGERGTERSRTARGDQRGDQKAEQTGDEQRTDQRGEQSAEGRSRRRRGRRDADKPGRDEQAGDEGRRRSREPQRDASAETDAQTEGTATREADRNADERSSEPRGRRRGGRRGSNSEAGTGESGSGPADSGQAAAERAQATAEIVPLAERRPSEEQLARSKRRPKRDRAALSDAATGPAGGAVAAGASAATVSAASSAAGSRAAAESEPTEMAIAASRAEPAGATAKAAAEQGEAPAVMTAEASAADAGAVETAVVEATVEAEAAPAPQAGKPEMQAAADATPAAEAAPAAEAGPVAEGASEAEPAPAAEAPAEATSGAATPAEQPAEPARRAYNDPREVRRRQREAELKAQGVITRKSE